MGEIWSKTCEQGRDRRDQLALRQAGSQAACAAVIAGMGLYCDACERLCRAYGEWFSWNCPSCDFDMCNKCLEESRNSWAVLPRRFQRAASRNPGPRDSGKGAQTLFLRPS